LLSENFAGWIDAVRDCVDQLRRDLPKGTDPKAVATFVLAVMEGGVMLSRSYGSVQPFDLAVAQLRTHFTFLTSKRNRRRVAKGRPPLKDKGRRRA
jgi:hypothetical protein